MLKPMCSSDPGEWTNAAVSSRHGSLAACTGANHKAVVTPKLARCPTYSSTQMPMIVRVTTGRESARVGAPNREVTRGWDRAAAATQSTHWMPTAAGR